MIIKLSEKDIDSAIRWVRDLKEDIIDANGQIVQQLSDIGFNKAMETNATVPTTGKSPSAVVSDVNVFKGKGVVYLFGKDAVFDEFGTGEEGAASPHPQVGKIGFTMPPYSGYITGPIVTKLIDEQGRHYWNVPANNRPSNTYVNPDTGKTYGIPSGRQIYSASVEVRKRKNEVARDTLNKVIKQFNRR